MIFKDTWEQVLNGTKTQTRRLVKAGDISLAQPGAGGSFYPPRVVADKNRRVRWEIMKDKSYAVQANRGTNAIGRIRITKIRRERLREISRADIFAELGPPPFAGDQAVDYFRIDEFSSLWNGLHKKSGTRWNDNPEVWVLEFELAE